MRRYRQRLERLFRRIPRRPDLPPVFIHNENNGRYTTWSGLDFGTEAECLAWIDEHFTLDDEPLFVVITCPEDPERDTDRPLPGAQSQGPSHSEGEGGGSPA